MAPAMMMSCCHQADQAVEWTRRMMRSVLDVVGDALKVGATLVID
jgi:hypothetical protein